MPSDELLRYDLLENPRNVFWKRLVVLCDDQADIYDADAAATTDQKAWAALTLKDPERMATRMQRAILRQGPALTTLRNLLANNVGRDDALDQIPQNQILNRIQTLAPRYKNEVV
jgi:hypothetical protein